MLLCAGSELAGVEDSTVMYLHVRDFSYVY